MKIDRINIFPVVLPFTAEFSHSLSRSRSAENVIVEVVADSGRTRGYGEAAPRAYVTGETQAGAVSAVEQLVRDARFPRRVDDPETVWAFTGAFLGKSARHAALCALETAMLDGLARSRNRPVGSFFPDSHRTDSIRYGAAVPLAGYERTLQICRFIRDGLKIRRIKLKLGRELDANRRALEAVRVVYGADCDLKVDVNGAWDLSLAMAHLPLIREYRIRAVEQPMMPGAADLPDFALALQRRGVAVMADESACSLDDVREIRRQGHYDMINVRLSKCGGFLGALRMVDYLRRHRMAFQVACHLGESGVLSAAGRAMSLACRDAVYHDGSYDAFLLQINVTDSHVSFGPGGIAGPLPGPGLGIRVDRERLEGLAGGVRTVELA